MTDEELIERDLPGYFESVPANVYESVRDLVDEYVSKIGEMTKQDMVYVCCQLVLELAKRKGLYQ